MHVPPPYNVLHVLYGMQQCSSLPPKNQVTRYNTVLVYNMYMYIQPIAIITDSNENIPQIYCRIIYIIQDIGNNNDVSFIEQLIPAYVQIWDVFYYNVCITTTFLWFELLALQFVTFCSVYFGPLTTSMLLDLCIDVYVISSKISQSPNLFSLVSQ